MRTTKPTITSKHDSRNGMRQPQATIASAGSSVALTDEKGNVIASFIPAKQYNNIVITSPSLKNGSSYKLVIGGTVSGADKNGYASSGSVSSAAQTLDIKLTGITTSFGNGGMSGGMGGGMGGMY